MRYLSILIGVLLLSGSLYLLANVNGEMMGQESRTIGGQTDQRGMGPPDDYGKMPPWAGSSDGFKGMEEVRMRYGADQPSAAVEGENGGYASLLLDGIELIGDNGTRWKVGQETEWTVEAIDVKSGYEITYRKEFGWGDGTTVPIDTSIVEVRFRMVEMNGERNLTFHLNISDVPEEGDLSIRMNVSTGLEGNECGIQDGTAQNRYRLHDRKGRLLGELAVAEEANCIYNGTEKKIDVESQLAPTGCSHVLDIGMSLDGNPESISVQGNVLLFEEFMDLITTGVTQAAQYVMDHILSFLIGAALIVVVVSIVIGTYTREGPQTDGSELDLRSNRFYRPPS